MKFKILLILTYAFICTNLQSNELPISLKEIDSLITRTMKQWNVPGVSVSIVKDGTTILSKGYGVKKYGKQDSVDSNTIFAIASNTKTFTCAALAMLVDDEKLDWDDKVIDHLPEFRLYDPYMTREITIRDLVSHRSGLIRKDAIAIRTGNTREEIMHLLRYHEPDFSFRSQFGYNSILYIVAGLVLENITGMTWDQFIHERIFSPLDMKSSNTSIKEISPNSNAATPHFVKLNDKPRALNWVNADNGSPCGGINSSANDMAQWMKMILNRGQYNSEQIVSSTQINEMQFPYTIIENFSPHIEKLRECYPSHFFTYGLGHFLYDYKGYQIVDHGGTFIGFKSHVGFIPEKNVGITVLANGQSMLPQILFSTIMDQFFEGEHVDFNSLLYNHELNNLKQQKENRKELKHNRKINTEPTLPLTQYQGIYENKMYGEIIIELIDGQLQFELKDSDGIQGHLEHWHYDTFRSYLDLPEVDPEGIHLAQFHLDKTGKVQSFEHDAILWGMWDEEFQKVHEE